MFKTIEKEAEATVVEKKSKFIANIFYIENEKEAEEMINKIKKKYHDARHNCFAYRVNGENGIIQKQSDDGEPTGTAGAPMLNILEKRELVNVVVIVTRYFGGILLGTGGLVKAYSEATKKALENAIEIKREEGYVIEILTEYEEDSKFQRFCIQNDINIIKREYTDKIKNIVEISKNNYKKTEKENFQKITIEIKKQKNIKIK